MIGEREFRWLPHDGRRHAIPDRLDVGDEGQTLCGVRLTVPRRAGWKSSAGLWPTCADCDCAWREREGISRFPQSSSGSSRRRTAVIEEGA
ncbi:hypothetical protein Amir_3647 [Actinosynnema mirum DSM 43827]|uniref:Zinc finger protein n=1 Tax=Actinosynnema mirum (strain ATCC 29888 / DSM 43827 / JCM 3225 / NBRC 14064 / NCIMB 13271 / NRRL B-12336 / IMRU 3971 / 101) TaxID=446462 RepID=C6WBW5_ACTMD|nr:zinc finger protein [Actinosynnema mirum]ACU37532.1 hypothetical protein Amir_3647 [Actinosynnema mirum DSM 43827]